MLLVVMIIPLLLSVSDHGRIVRVTEDYTLGPVSTWHKKSLILFFPDNATEPIVVHGKTADPLPIGNADVELGPVVQTRPQDRFKTHRKLKSAHATKDRKRRAVPDGERSILIVMLNYTDLMPSSYCNHNCVYNKMWSPASSVNVFFKEASFYRISFPASAGALYSISIPKATTSLAGCAVDDMGNDALDNWNSYTRIQHHRGSDYSSDVDPADFDHVAFYIPALSACQWAGSAYVNSCNELTNNYCRLWMKTSSISTLAHEIGHNIGLHHSSSDPEDVRRNFNEYGDGSDVMGSASNVVFFNRPHLEALGYHTGNDPQVTNSTLFIDNFFNCSSVPITVTLGPVSVKPSVSKKYTAIKFYRVPSPGEVSDTNDYCAAVDCGCGSNWKTTVNYDSEYNVQRNEYIYYYISYRDGTSSIDQNLDQNLKGKVFIHSYAPNANTYFPDRTYLVKVLGNGESWSSSTTGVTVTVVSGPTVSVEFQCTAGTTRPSCSDCPGYTCSEPIQTSTSNPNNNPEFESQTSSKDNLSSDAIIGISVGSAVALAAIAFVVNRSMNSRKNGYDQLNQTGSSKTYNAAFDPPTPAPNNYGKLQQIN